MQKRTFWLQRIEKSFESRKLIWLAGVRRVGKTTLCRSLPGVQYFDCELPRVRRMLEDPEAFWRARGEGIVALDEVHRL